MAGDAAAAVAGAGPAVADDDAAAERAGATRFAGARGVGADTVAAALALEPVVRGAAGERENGADDECSHARSTTDAARRYVRLRTTVWAGAREDAASANLV